MERSLLIVGATGLVGGFCVEQALRDDAFSRVTVIGRRPLPSSLASRDSSGKLIEHVFDLEDIEAHEQHVAADAIICALGTTRRAAGSKEQFERVDREYPRRIARVGKAQGVRHFLLVSAIGADSSSRFFYNRVKGRVEEDVRAVGFHRYTIVRPSVLLGDRPASRPGERIAGWLSRLLPEPYRGVHAEAVARVLVLEARAWRPGERVFESRELQREGNRLHTPNPHATSL